MSLKLQANKQANVNIHLLNKFLWFIFHLTVKVPKHCIVIFLKGYKCIVLWSSACYNIIISKFLVQMLLPQSDQVTVSRWYQGVFIRLSDGSCLFKDTFLSFYSNLSIYCTAYSVINHISSIIMALNTVSNFTEDGKHSSLLILKILHRNNG